MAVINMLIYCLSMNVCRLRKRQTCLEKVGPIFVFTVFCGWRGGQQFNCRFFRPDLVGFSRPY